MTDKQREREYRRGFRDGWIIAVNKMYEGMIDHRYARLAAYMKLRDWAEKELFEWMHGDCSKLVMPPGSPLGEPIVWQGDKGSSA